MTQFADDVAKALHRRMRRRRFAFASVFAALVAAAIYFVTCGHGFGLGGHGTGSGVAPASDGGPSRCLVRVAANGYTVDGKAGVTREVVVAACQKTKAAEVTVTGDAREGDWTELRRMLEDAHVAVFEKH